MSPTAPLQPERTDPELISRVREGDVAAYGEIFSRHVDSATRLARLLVGEPDADDLVSEAFVKVLNVLLAGGGPDLAFRAYLLTAVRRLHIDKVRSAKHVTPAGDLSPWDPGVPFTDTAVAGFEDGAAAKAFASLPERWQMVLWHLEVEGQKPAEIAPLLGISANSVSALAYRAREGLRQAFLNMHCGDLVSEACRDTNDLMGGYVRGGLSRRDATKVEEHLGRCRRCTGVYLELTEVNSSLAGLLAPALLGAAAAAYLAGEGAFAAGAVGLGSGLLGALGRGKDYVLANTGTVAAGAGTAAAAAIAGIVALAVVRGAPATEPDAVEVPPSPSTSTSSPIGPSTRPDLTSLSGEGAQQGGKAAQGEASTAAGRGRTPGSKPGSLAGTSMPRPTPATQEPSQPVRTMMPARPIPSSSSTQPSKPSKPGETVQPAKPATRNGDSGRHLGHAKRPDNHESLHPNPGDGGRSGGPSKGQP